MYANKNTVLRSFLWRTGKAERLPIIYDIVPSFRDNMKHGVLMERNRYLES
jgi:hypothetical protein